MRKITLNKILRERTAAVDSYNDTDEPGEGGAEQPPVVTSIPVIINVDMIRCFNARRDNKPGSRITFTDGGGFAVTETVDEVNTLTNDPGTATPAAAPITDVAPVADAAPSAARNGSARASRAARNGGASARAN